MLVLQYDTPGQFADTFIHSASSHLIPAAPGIDTPPEKSIRDLGNALEGDTTALEKVLENTVPDAPTNMALPSIASSAAGAAQNRRDLAGNLESLIGATVPKSDGDIGLNLQAGKITLAATATELDVSCWNVI